MTDFDVTANDRSVSYTAVASQTIFPYDFPILTTDQIRVTRSRGGSPTILLEGSEYSVSGAGSSEFGNVTLVSASLVDDTILIEGRTPLTREGGFGNTAQIGSADLNGELDRLWMAMQEQARDLAAASLGIVDAEATLDEASYTRLVIQGRIAQFINTTVT